MIDELGDEKLHEFAGLLGTDEAGAQDVISETVSALSGGLQDKAQGAPEDVDEVRQAFAEVGEAANAAPLQGVATLGGGLGGMLSGGMMAGVLAKVSKPVAQAVSKKTGIPAATVSRGIELLIPVLLAVLTKRAAASKAGGGSAPKASGASGDPIPSPGAVPGTATGGTATGAAPAGGQASGGGLDLGDLLGSILGGGKKQ
ncbi:protein of unknown function [Streptomyces indicus]|uniref:DUF937 domain-containing protein n=1 Tax=Streptomyces indicus TaxID=417292 RepID=A0A1G9G9N9_9ACTN|nr:protein of unknown function [Streptomyces indicus]